MTSDERIIATVTISIPRDGVDHTMVLRIAVDAGGYFIGTADEIGHGTRQYDKRLQDDDTAIIVGMRTITSILHKAVLDKFR